MWKGLLPIGSVVLLKDGDKRLMVVGQCVSKEDDMNRIFDYSAVLYPEGLEDPDSIYMFNAQNIERVYSIGYMDEESGEVMQKMQATLDQLRSELAKAGSEQA